MSASAGVQSSKGTVKIGFFCLSCLKQLEKKVCYCACKYLTYCSEECQQKDAPSHKPLCVGKPAFITLKTIAEVVRKAIYSTAGVRKSTDRYLQIANTQFKISAQGEISVETLETPVARYDDTHAIAITNQDKYISSLSTKLDQQFERVKTLQSRFKDVPTALVCSFYTRFCMPTEVTFENSVTIHDCGQESCSCDKATLFEQNKAKISQSWTSKLLVDQATLFDQYCAVVVLQVVIKYGDEEKSEYKGSDKKEPPQQSTTTTTTSSS